MSYSPFRTKRNPLIYSDEFRKAVLKAYPTHDEIKQRLDENEYFLGRYLDDCSNGCVPSIDTETIINYLEHGDAKSLLDMAYKNLEKIKEAKLRVEVYRMWDKEVFED